MSIGGKAASVRFDGVSKAYGELVAINNVSFTVEAGSLVTILGPSGCGKTTTLRLIAGLEMCTGGRIFIGDKNVTTLPATDRDISMVFQSYALFPHMSVRENVAYGLVVNGLDKSEIKDRVASGLDLVGLKDFGERMPSELSGGQQQRVAVARALVLEPQVLLLDEPLSNLDAKLRRQVRQEIRDIQQSLGLTAVYVTHDQQEALAVSDHIVVMKNAAIAQHGTPHELYEEPADLFVADFIGDANVIDAQIVAVEGKRASVEIAGVTLNLPSRDLRPGAIKVAIRPESIKLIPNQQNDADAINGHILKASYLGSHMEYTVDSPLGELFVVDPNIGTPLQRDNTISIVFGDHGITLVKEPSDERISDN